MAGKGGKVSAMRVAVCGLTSSSFNGLQGQGAGKSCLCNRFFQETHDKFTKDHTSVINLSEFGSNVINNTHFLYWGEKVASLEDGQDVKFQIVEHTEFVDDSSLRPFPSSKVYTKRCLQLKLQSGGKVGYIESNQLALPEHYQHVPKFPDKFSVDGFIVCADVSTSLNDPRDPQKQFLETLLGSLQGSKKPILVVLTKYDRAKPASIATINEIVSKFKKIQGPFIEVSAVKGINVDMCFLALAHLIDSKKPRTKITSYADSKSQLDERIRRLEEALQVIMDELLVDFYETVPMASSKLKTIVEFNILKELAGSDRVNRLVRGKLSYLKQQRVKQLTASYEDQLVGALKAMIPTLGLNDNAETCQTRLKKSSDFDLYFVDVSDWKENRDFLKKTDEKHVPFSFILEDPGKGILSRHIDEVLVQLRADAAASTIRHVLSTTKGILPGAEMVMLWSDLDLLDQTRWMSQEQQIFVYNECMGKLEQECVADLTELFMERSDLFNEISSPKDTFDHVHEELKDVPRYKRLDCRTQLRMSQALKHIASLQMPDKSPVYGRSGLHEAIAQLQSSPALSREQLAPPKVLSRKMLASDGLHWILDSSDSVLNLCLLARTEDNVLTLRSDFMNHFSGSGTIAIEDRRYQVELGLQHGHISTLSSQEFTPQGAVAVVTSLECLDWLEDLIGRLWLPEVGRKTPPYRGMPLVILALDKDATPSDSGLSLSASGSSSSSLVQSSLSLHSSTASSEIHGRASELAWQLQCVCITETPTPQPMRLVVTAIIHKMLLSLVNAISHLEEFYHAPLIPREPEGFNVAMCTLVGDPYPNEALLQPLVRHQCVSVGGEGEPVFFIKTAIERQHRTTVLSFHSMFNLPELLASVHLGFILVYSTQRRASLSVLTNLLPKLPDIIPKMIVAMGTSDLASSKLVEEGEEIARKHDAMFYRNVATELPTGFEVELLRKCWSRRFSSWKAQNLSNHSRKKQTRALPQRPSDMPLPAPPTGGPPPPTTLPPPPPPSSLPPPPPLPTSVRHSVAVMDSPIVYDHMERRASLQPNKIEDIYSNPSEQKISKKSSTLDRRRQGKATTPQFLSPEHLIRGSMILEQHSQNGNIADLSDYASVEDAVKHTELLAALGRQTLSPSMSPPPLPPPPSSKLQPSSSTDVPDDLAEYATVDSTSNPRLTSPTGKGRGYDHLAPDETGTTYDKLDPPERPPRTDLTRSQERSSNGYIPVRKGQEKAFKVAPPISPSGEEYATIGDSRQSTPKQDSDIEMYASVDTSTRKLPKPRLNPPSHVPAAMETSEPHSSQPTQNGGSDLYSVVNKPRGNRPIPAPRPLPRTRRSPDPHTEYTSGGGGDLYSVPNKPRMNAGHHRIPSEDHILHYRASDGAGLQDHIYSAVEKPTPPKPKPRRAITPENALYSVPDKTERKKPNHSPPVQRQVQHNRNNSPSIITTRPHPRLAHMRSGSVDVVLNSRPMRTHSLEGKQASASPQPVRSPSPEIKTFRSLPSSYRNRTRSNELILQHQQISRSREEFRTCPPWTSSPPQRRRQMVLLKGREERVQSSHMTVVRGGSREEDEEKSGPTLPERRYSLEDLDLDAEPPPLPERNFSWSDIEDNDEEFCQSDNELDEPSTIDHQMVYSSIRRLSMHSNRVSGTIGDFYNVINSLDTCSEMPEEEDTPPDLWKQAEDGGSDSAISSMEGVSKDEQLYDTLEDLMVKSLPPSITTRDVSPIDTYATIDELTRSEPVGGKSPSSSLATPLPSSGGSLDGKLSLQAVRSSMRRLSPRELRVIKQQQKLLQKLEKKMEREAERRKRQDRKKRKKEEEELKKEGGKKKGKKGKASKNAPSRYFGSPLSVVAKEDGIPVFVRQCVDAVERNGLDMEGIYRVSGKKDDCLLLQDKFDEDPSLDIESLDLRQNAISSTLKAFFKLLPEPLISNVIAAKILVINSLDTNSQRTRLHEILGGMPQANLATLRYLVQHLYKVQQQQQLNKMNASNLAIVFWPTLMRPPLSDLADPSKQLGWQLVMTMMIQHPEFVP